MKKLLVVALGPILFGISACGNGSTGPALVTATGAPSATPDSSVKNGACHYQDFEKGVDILYEDQNICFSYNPGAVVYQVRLPFVQTVGQYREQKKIAEQRIDELAKEYRCQVGWAPPMDLEGLVQQDHWTNGCPLPGK